MVSPASPAEVSEIFCRNSSLRGVSKISKANTQFLRCLWFVFVLIMFVFLIYSAIMVVSNYRDYDVAIQTSMSLNNYSYFPTVTICNHYPFSERAIQLWKDGKTTSPKQFNSMLRNVTRELLLNNKIEMASQLPFYDKIRVFYQNLPMPSAIDIGHSVKEFVLHCMIIHGSHSLVSKNQECGLKFELVSNPRYFNCYSIKPKNDYFSQRVSSIYLIIDLGIEPDFGSWEQAFIMDIFDQAYGLRLSLHETNLFPNMDRNGIHIEPGKMVEVAFDTIHWEEAKDSPKDRCQSGEEPYIYDLGKNYSYSYQACIDQHLNQVIINSCNCILAKLPRPVIRPTKALPYCENIDPNDLTSFFSRLKCLENLNVKEIRSSVEGTKCRKRCVKFEYDKQASMTKWRPTDFQLHWMMDQSQSWKDLIAAETAKDAIAKAKISSHIMEYLNSTDLMKVSHTSKMKFSVPDYSNKYAYVIIKRNSFDTIVKKEKLTVTFEALMSRIGGLCSLYLGLTMAFFVEIVEFFYLMGDYFKKKKEDTVHQKLVTDNSEM